MGDDEMTRMAQAPPLTGIRVLEVGNYMAGPFCGMQLADLGADVIKVENPEGGDMSRQGGPFVDGEGANFLRINRNKRSLALDLKSEAGKEIFRKLIAQADIVVENLRPGTMRGLELDYELLRAINPRLIYVAASGWGQDGPYAPLPGLDIMAQAMSGLMSITGEEGGGPVKIGVPMCDLVCALYGALGAVAALRVREETGKGQLIDVSLFEAGVSFSIYEAAKYFTTGEIPRRHGSAHQTNALYQALRTSDGYFTVGANSEKNWAAFCKVAGLEHLINDSRFVGPHLRREHLAELLPMVEAVTVTKTSRWWVDELQKVGVPCALLQNYDQVFNDPHLLARDYFVDAPHAKVGNVRQLSSPMRLSESPLKIRRAGPLLGEDTADILGELGLDANEISALNERGVVGLACVLS
jgi:crotonobetainyl-CoA:carnitine CoA-transferase CaiB-like acyl-CoA transferase